MRCSSEGSHLKYLMAHTLAGSLPLLNCVDSCETHWAAFIGRIFCTLPNIFEPVRASLSLTVCKRSSSLSQFSKDLLSRKLVEFVKFFCSKFKTAEQFSVKTCRWRLARLARLLFRRRFPLEVTSLTSRIRQREFHFKELFKLQLVGSSNGTLSNMLFGPKNLWNFREIVWRLFENTSVLWLTSCELSKTRREFSLWTSKLGVQSLDFVEPAGKPN